MKRLGIVVVVVETILGTVITISFVVSIVESVRDGSDGLVTLWIAIVGRVILGRVIRILVVGGLVVGVRFCVVVAYDVVIDTCDVDRIGVVSVGDFIVGIFSVVPSIFDLVSVVVLEALVVSIFVNGLVASVTISGPKLSSKLEVGMKRVGEDLSEERVVFSVTFMAVALVFVVVDITGLRGTMVDDVSDLVFSALVDIASVDILVISVIG